MVPFGGAPSDFGGTPRGPRDFAQDPLRHVGLGAAGRMHTVASGDSLYTIAKRYYGNGAKSKTDIIYAANRDKMNSPDALRIGLALTIPAADPLQ